VIDPVLTLENMERDAGPESQAELQELADKLREEGFSVEVAPVDGPFHAILEESATHELLEVLNVVLDQAEAHAIDAAIGAVSVVVTEWARSRFRFRSRDGERATAVIWGPDGRPLRRVPLPDPEDDEQDREYRE
jgi:NTP pyrophosphatase (non-canonical NTP hydrolase)